MRDQKPMHERKLATCLTDGMSPEDWHRHLNRRVFFWETQDRLERMVGAKAYRGDPHTVLTISTRRLVDRYEDVIHVATINTGNTAYQAVSRGRDTFVPLRDFDYHASRRKRGPRRAIAEVVIDYAIPDVRDPIVRVERWVGGLPSTVIWQPRAGERHQPGRA